MNIYSYIEANGQTFQPPRREGPDGPELVYLAKLDDRHYVAVEGKLPQQSPAIQLRGPIDLAGDPDLYDRLNRSAEPWRIARQRRAEAYPAIADQLDAIMKEFAAMRASGQRLTPELDRMVDACVAIKANHPKPDIGLDS